MLGLAPGTLALMTGGNVAVSFSSWFAHFSYSWLRGGRPPLPSSLHAHSVCLRVYFSAKLLVLPEERKVGVLIYGSADKAAVWELSGRL